MTTEATIDLDLDPDFEAVRLRAFQRGGAAVPETDPACVPCARARASNRLFVRRWAARRQRPGESWSYLDTLGLVDEELARMGASAEESAGCGACVVCSPPACPRCGGLGGGCDA